MQSETRITNPTPEQGGLRDYTGMDSPDNVSLKDLIGATCTEKVHFLSRGQNIETPKSSMLDLEHLWDG